MGITSYEAAREMLRKNALNNKDGVVIEVENCAPFASFLLGLPRRKIVGAGDIVVPWLYTSRYGTSPIFTDVIALPLLRELGLDENINGDKVENVAILPVDYYEAQGTKKLRYIALTTDPLDDDTNHLLVYAHVRNQAKQNSPKDGIFDLDNSSMAVVIPLDRAAKLLKTTETGIKEQLDANLRLFIKKEEQAAKLFVRV